MQTNSTIFYNINALQIKIFIIQYTQKNFMDSPSLKVQQLQELTNLIIGHPQCICTIPLQFMHQILGSLHLLTFSSDDHRQRAQKTIIEYIYVFEQRQVKYQELMKSLQPLIKWPQISITIIFDNITNGVRRLYQKIVCFDDKEIRQQQNYEINMSFYENSIVNQYQQLEQNLHKIQQDKCTYPYFN